MLMYVILMFFKKIQENWKNKARMSHLHFNDIFKNKFQRAVILR